MFAKFGSSLPRSQSALPMLVRSRATSCNPQYAPTVKKERSGAIQNVYGSSVEIFDAAISGKSSVNTQRKKATICVESE